MLSKQTDVLESLSNFKTAGHGNIILGIEKGISQTIKTIGTTGELLFKTIFSGVGEDIPCKVLNSHLPKDVEGLFIELNFRNKKWLLFGGYIPKKERISQFISNISNRMNKYTSNYDNIIILGDFKWDFNIKEKNYMNFVRYITLKIL